MTLPPHEDTKHLSPQSVDEYFASRVATAIVVCDSPRITLEIDPGQDEVRILLPASGEAPQVTPYESISIERVQLAGLPGDWYRLTISAESKHREAYQILEAIADELKGGLNFVEAFERSLSRLHALLAPRAKLTNEELVGLFGELTLLEHVIKHSGAKAACDSWLGPTGEQHDFMFASYDVEVKTTRYERREHLIGSATQLLPIPNRSLYLVSLQLTRAGDAHVGRTIAALIDQLRAECPYPQLNSHLSTLGWLDSDRDLYPQRFVLRSSPYAYLVDDQFPAITPERLKKFVPNSALVSSVSYRIDVTSVSPSTPPPALVHFCEEPS